MSFNNYLLSRAVRVLVYWGLVGHPYGIEYARWRYSPTGRFIEDPEDSSPEESPEAKDSHLQ
jgi:hypothetical protein